MKQKEAHRNSITLPRTKSAIMPAAIAAITLFALSAPAGQAAGFVTSVQPYAVPISPDYQVHPILSVGDRVSRAIHRNNFK